VTEFVPTRILAGLADADVRYVAVGAVALIAHGVVRATSDVDIVPDPGPDNLAQLGGLSASVPRARFAGRRDEVDGVPLRVVSRNDLIRLKAGTGRDRDLLDIGDLLALEE
jgi:hypothetical protein